MLRTLDLFFLLREHYELTFSVRHPSVIPDHESRHTSAYVRIRQHTSTHVSTRNIRQRTSSYVNIRQCTSYVSTRQDTSVHVNTRQHTQHTSSYVIISQHTTVYAGVRQLTSTYIGIRQHTSAYKVSNTSSRSGGGAGVGLDILFIRQVRPRMG